MNERATRDRSDQDLFAARSSGVLLHPTSLPGPYGIGDIGRSAHRFADYLTKAGQGFWQMLPVGPVGAGFSPYASPSSLAGNPLLVSLEALAERGLLRSSELAPPREFQHESRAQYRSAARYREQRLRLAFERFERGKIDGSFERFRHANRSWLADWALYSAILEAEAGRAWPNWPPELRTRKRSALRAAARRLDRAVRYHEFVQWAFDWQWRALKEHSARLGIRLLGDVPMFVAHDGVETWQNPELFYLDAHGRPSVVAGVPPDNFSRTGQLWGNPLYRWDALKRSGFRFWIERLSGALERFDAVRLDHFIGFHRCWEVPASAQTAESGRFVKGPRDLLFRKLSHTLGSLPFVAEDLGLVTEEVRALAARWQLPGMRVLQFGFDPGAGEHLPHNYPRRTLVCTGTHDTQTIVGWYRALPAETRKRVRKYAELEPGSEHWGFARMLLSSVANLVIFPLQDVIGLDNRARMNVPGTPTGNWDWRVRERDLDPLFAERLNELVTLYERRPMPVETRFLPRPAQRAPARRAQS